LAKFVQYSIKKSQEAMHSRDCTVGKRSS